MTEGPYKLPEGWRWVRLGEVASLFSGTWGEDPMLKDLDDSVVLVRAIRVSDIKETLTIDYEKVPVRSVKQKQAKKYALKDGDIVVVKSSGSKAKVISGRAALFVNQKERFIPSNFVFCVRPKSEAIQAVFLWCWLNSIPVKMHIEKIVSTFTYPNLKKSDYINTPVPLPPLPEQRRIVARIEELMARVREARRLRQQAREDAERLWQSVLAETFPRPGSDLPQGWRWVRLGEVCEHKTGIWGPEAASPDLGFPVVRSTEIDGLFVRAQTASVRFIDSTKVEKYKLEHEDILVNKSSGSPHLVGWPAIFEDPEDGRVYLFSNFMMRLRTNRELLNPWFLLFYLHSPQARSIYLGAQDTTSGLRNLRVKDFMDQIIPLSPLPEQRRIVAHLEEVRERILALKKAQEDTEARLEDLERSILDKAFRGEL